MMKEIGGYIEFEHFHRPMLHGEGILLNSGRSCLAYLIEARGIKKLLLPYFNCDSVTMLCAKYSVEMRFYHMREGFEPEITDLQEDEWLYVINYYGQVPADRLREYREKYGRVIVDNAQAYFAPPMEGMDTLYTCRKFFGVADGGVLFTDAKPAGEYPADESHARMEFLFGRMERTASEFYAGYRDNNARFREEGIKRMSAVTENLLRGVEYGEVKRIREENFAYLDSRLGERNQLKLLPAEGAFAYPFMVSGGAELRKALIANKIYIPLLWPNVLQDVGPETYDYRLANDLLPVPCDQRYGKEEMEYICQLIDRNL